MILLQIGGMREVRDDVLPWKLEREDRPLPLKGLLVARADFSLQKVFEDSAHLSQHCPRAKDMSHKMAEMNLSS